MKRLLVTLFSVLLTCAGLAVVLTTSSAQASKAEPDCVPKEATPDSFTEWVDDGGLITTEENAPPGADTDTVRFIFAGQTEPEVIEEAEASKWWNFSPNQDQGPLEGEPAFPTDPRGTWQGPHTNGGPGQDETGTFQQGQGNASWFHREPAKDAVTDTDFLWQKQVREFIEGTDAVVCEPPAPACPDDTDKAGQVIPAGQTAEEFCDDGDVGGVDDGDPPSGVDDVGDVGGVIEERDEVGGVVREQQDAPADVLPRSGA